MIIPPPVFVKFLEFVPLIYFRLPLSLRMLCSTSPGFVVLLTGGSNVESGLHSCHHFEQAWHRKPNSDAVAHRKCRSCWRRGCCSYCVWRYAVLVRRGHPTCCPTRRRQRHSRNTRACSPQVAASAIMRIPTCDHISAS